MSMKPRPYERTQTVMNEAFTPRSARAVVSRVARSVLCLLVLVPVLVPASAGAGRPDTASVKISTLPAVVTAISFSTSVWDVAVDPTRHRAFVTTAPDNFFAKASDLRAGRVSVVHLKNNAVGRHVTTGLQPVQTVFDSRDNRFFTVDGAGYSPTAPGRNLEVFSGTTFKRLAVMKPPTNGVTEMGGVLSPMIYDPVNNNVYLVAGNQIDIINGSSLKVTGTIPVANVNTGMAIDTKTQLLYVTLYSQAAVAVVDLRTNKIVNAAIEVGHPATPAGCYAGGHCKNQPSGTDGVSLNTRTGKLYAANVNDGNIAVVDYRTDTAKGTILPGLGQGTNMIAVDSAANILYVSNFDVGAISVIDGRTDRTIGTLRLKSITGPIAVDPAAHRLYAVTDNGIDIYGAHKKEPFASTLTVLSTCSVNRWVSSRYHVTGLLNGC